MRRRYFTGSDLFNTQMRLIALEKGFTLNEYEVCKLADDGTKGAPIKVKTERDMCVLRCLCCDCCASRGLPGLIYDIRSHYIALRCSGWHT